MSPWKKIFFLRKEYFLTFPGKNFRYAKVVLKRKGQRLLPGTLLKITPFVHRSINNMIYCFLPFTFFLAFDLMTGTGITQTSSPVHGWLVHMPPNEWYVHCTGPLMPDCSTDPDSSDHTV